MTVDSARLSRGWHVSQLSRMPAVLALGPLMLCIAALHTEKPLKNLVGGLAMIQWLKHLS